MPAESAFSATPAHSSIIFILLSTPCLGLSLLPPHLPRHVSHNHLQRQQTLRVGRGPRILHPNGRQRPGIHRPTLPVRILPPARLPPLPLRILPEHLLSRTQDRNRSPMSEGRRMGETTNPQTGVLPTHRETKHLQLRPMRARRLQDLDQHTKGPGRSMPELQ